MNTSELKPGDIVYRYADKKDIGIVTRIDRTDKICHIYFVYWFRLKREVGRYGRDGLTKVEDDE